SPAESAFTPTSASGEIPGAGTVLRGGSGPLQWARTGPSGANVTGCRMRSLRSRCWGKGLCHRQKPSALADGVVTSASTTRTPRLAALRYHDYRLLWLGELVSTVGSQMQVIAINWHLYQLLKGMAFSLSLFGRHVEVAAGAAGLGLLGLVRVLPIIVFALL